MFLSMLLGVVSLLAEPLWAREPNSLPGVHVSVLGDSNDLDRVIIGSRGKVESYERLKEVVVIGGRLDIYGEVEKLVLIGSEAQLYAGSAVNRDLVIIGA